MYFGNETYCILNVTTIFCTQNTSNSMYRNFQPPLNCLWSKKWPVRKVISATNTWCNGVLSAINSDAGFPLAFNGFEGVRVCDFKLIGCWTVWGWTNNGELFKNCPCIVPEENWLVSAVGCKGWKSTPDDSRLLCGWRVEFVANGAEKEDRTCCGGWFAEWLTTAYNEDMNMIINKYNVMYSKTLSLKLEMLYWIELVAINLTLC